MGTTAEKLTYLNTTKAKIRTGLNDLGAQLTENDTFRSYANVLTDIYDELPKVTGSGTDLELTPTKKGKLAITPKGNSSQFSTNGTNIIDLTTEQCKVSLSAGDKITMTNQTSSRMDIRLFTNYGDTNHNDYWRVDANSSRTITVAYNSKAIAWATDATGGLAWGNLGETALPYELYTDGPAPNPNYSFPVKAVTGENSIVIQSENLIPTNVEEWEQGGIDPITGINTSLTTRLRTKKYYHIENNTTYHISVQNTNYCFLNIILYDISKEYVGQYYSIDENINGATDININIPNITFSNVAYMRVTLRNSNNTSNITVNEITSIKPMMIKGSTAPSTYVEHEEQNYQLSLGNIELNSSPDGTIRDQIVGSPNNWFKREYIGKFVLDGTESGWTLRGTDTNTYRFTNNTVIANALAKNNTSLYFCNEFQIYAGNSGIANIDDNGIALRDSLNGFTIRILKTLVTGLDNFKTWLSNHNAIGYYLLATPVDVPITDTTLISQLNNIYNNSHSCNGVTNITTTYEDGNEQMVLDADALKSWEVI